MVDIFQVSYSVFKQAANAQTTVYHYPIGTASADGYVLGTGTKDFVYWSKITDNSDINDFLITLLPTSNAVEMEDDALALPTLQVNNTIQRFDLGGTDFLYIGSAPIGTLDSDPGWTINRHQLDSNGNVINKEKTAQNSGTWDDRVTETYF